MAIAALLSLSLSKDEAVPVAEIQKPVVQLTTAAAYNGQQVLSLIGTARAFTEAQVTAELAGRVTSVSVALGEYVQAGKVIGVLENATERASVLQAEGAYEAAVAAAAQSGVSIDQAQTDLTTAKNAAVLSYQGAYNTTNNVVRNTVDDFFSNTDSKYVGLRIDGRGFTTSLNSERVAYQTLLADWQLRSATISTTADLFAELQYARANVQRTITLLDSFLTVFSEQPNNARYTEAELNQFIAEFTAEKTTLIGVQSSLDAAEAGIISATESLKKAELAGVGSVASAADAQVKQALGVLRAAEANLEKTIFRTPISGTVNNLSIKAGDFINSFSTVAVIANNSALEIVTYVSEQEQSLLAVGDEVLIEGQYSGTITQIAPAVDTVTRKIEVRIATEAAGVVNGDTVRVTVQNTSSTARLEKVAVPLTAVKFDAENGSVFFVEDGRLVARPVTLGVIRGGSVEVVEGLSAHESFVRDVRGLQVNTDVTVIE